MGFSIYCCYYGMHKFESSEQCSRLHDCHIRWGYPGNLVHSNHQMSITTSLQNTFSFLTSLMSFCNSLSFWNCFCICLCQLIKHNSYTISALQYSPKAGLTHRLWATSGLETNNTTRNLEILNFRAYRHIGSMISMEQSCSMSISVMPSMDLASSV